jgi:single-strand DNA-binding protein
MYNKAILIGNLGKDPRVASLNNGDRVASFSIATSESWKDKTTGEKRERTEWHNVVLFGEGLVSIAERFLKKGSKVHLDGQIQTRKYTGQDGVERYTTEIVLRPFSGVLTLLGDSRAGPPPPAEDPRASAAPSSPRPATHDIDDEIPF